MTKLTRMFALLDTITNIDKMSTGMLLASTHDTNAMMLKSMIKFSKYKNILIVDDKASNIIYRIFDDNDIPEDKNITVCRSLEISQGIGNWDIVIVWLGSNLSNDKCRVLRDDTTTTTCSLNIPCVLFYNISPGMELTYRSNIFVHDLEVICLSSFTYTFNDDENELTLIKNKYRPDNTLWNVYGTITMSVR